MYARILTISLPLILVACGNFRDTDEDGLTDSEEKELGTNPEMSDTDGDGLSDLEERDMGTDGTLWDTDGDGYGDFEENQAGSDPSDDDDVIYEGGWPYNADKDSIEGNDWDDRIRVGDTMGRFVGFDQHGDEVDIYDFAGQGAPVMIDTSALDCGPCQGLAMWVSGQITTAEFSEWLTGNSDTLADWSAVPEAVDNGDLYWITIMYRSYQTGAAAGSSGVEGWDEDYPHDNIPVLTTDQDEDDTSIEEDDDVSYGSAWQEQVNNSFYPFVTLFDENLALIKNSSSRSSWTPPIDALVELLNE